jgi:hypothetical protein
MRERMEMEMEMLRRILILISISILQFVGIYVSYIVVHPTPTPTLISVSMAHTTSRVYHQNHKTTTAKAGKTSVVFPRQLPGFAAMWRDKEKPKLLTAKLTLDQ